MSLRVGVGLSRLRDSRSAAREAAREAKRTVPEPTVAFAFAGIKHDQREIHAGLAAELDMKIVLGGSSYAEVTNLGVTKDSVIVLLIRMEGSTLRTAGLDLGDDCVANGAAFASALGLGPESGATGERIPLGFYFGSIIDGKENRMLARMREACPGLPFFGGLCVGDYDLGMSHPDFWKNHQYFPDGVRQKGGRAAVWDIPRGGNKIAFAYDHGWEPVGPVVEFTKSEGEYAYEVAGVPIFDFYRQFLGPQDAGKFFEQMIQRYGFAVVMGPEDGPRPSLLRLPVQCDFERGRIRFFPAEDLAGRKVQLIQANRHGLIDGARRAAQRCRQALGLQRPALVFMVSCCTRNSILHSRFGDEAEAVREVFGTDVPLFGYYSGGEIFPLLTRYDDAADPALPLHGSYFHTTTVGMMALAVDPRPEAVGLPDAKRAAEEPAEERDRLRLMLAQSETIFDSTERFMANLSKKSFRDGELLKAQNEQLALKNEHNEKLQGVVHRYTPHDIWSRLGESVAKGVYELADAEGVFTFMFLDVKGFTAYSESHSAPEVVSAINALFKPATDIIYRCGGDVDKYIGDCIFAAFPDAASGVNAAREILALFADPARAGTPFSVRIGLNAGRAVRANVGSSERREYTYIGDAVNLAQRLESNCAPGRLLLSEGVFREAGTAFSSAERKEITVKGKAEPVVVYDCAL